MRMLIGIHISYTSRALTENPASHENWMQVKDNQYRLVQESTT